ncbi:phosphoenolpyruvate synthase [Candidatus Dependentiae bacterium]|nr:phosphoenolpyruvate synthase [Candidatus Dependentiae bacterium]
MKYIKLFTDITLADTSLVGGKNSSLGEMVQRLRSLGIKVPLGFAVTVQGYWDHLAVNTMVEPLKKIFQDLGSQPTLEALQKAGKLARELIKSAPLPDELIQQIKIAYDELSILYNQEDVDVAVRSSALSEDSPTASFAGQQETYLNVNGIEKVLEATQNCMASLFTDRAIVYRIEQGFDHLKIGISVGIQKMIRSDKASSGVTFSLDTDTGFKNVVVITSSYGLGENVVKGIVNPDEFHVHKETLALGFKPIIKKYLGSKEVKLIYSGTSGRELKNVPVPVVDQEHFSLSEDEILELARQTVLIENYYSEVHKGWCPMDIEWAKDGLDNQLYIVQARPETVYSQKTWDDVLVTYSLKDTTSQPSPLITGLSIGEKIVHGKAVILKDIHDQFEFNQGDILVTSMTDPDWVPLMKKAGAIVTDKGGRTCHAAIVSRELGIPALIGTVHATTRIPEGENVTVDCSLGARGAVYNGFLEYTVSKTILTSLGKPRVPILLNIGDPDRAYQFSFMPVSGVGLARVEFIITNLIKIHPMAAAAPQRIKDPAVRNKIEQLSVSSGDSRTFFVDTLAQGIGQIAGAFYPREVVVRFSDFKSNEYSNLVAGKDFEPFEENPMLGFRGASRYCDPRYAPAFELECLAMKKAREEMGFVNITLLVPFVRTLHEARCTLDALEKHGLKRGTKGLKILMMCEIPSNVILLEEFSRLFDGFSIGSNDLTQFTLAVDRDSEFLSSLFNEKDESVMKVFEMVLAAARKSGSYVSICGQAPSDFPEVADFLIERGISALSLNADSVIPFLLAEKIKKDKASL